MGSLYESRREYLMRCLHSLSGWPWWGGRPDRSPLTQSFSNFDSFHVDVDEVLVVIKVCESSRKDGQHEMMDNLVVMVHLAG